MKGYKLSMFQLMINTKSENIFNRIVNTIEEYENKLYKNKTKNKKYEKNIKIGKMKIHPPGKLQINIDKLDINEYIIGSIELKILINNKTNISVLLFKNKMKLSGGFVKEFFNDKLPNDEEFNEYVHELSSIIGSIFKVDLEKDQKISLLNSILKMDMIIPEFIKFCKKHFENNESYNRVIMPFTSERGRMCAIKVYPNQTNESVHFDHKGNLQFFGFKSVCKLNKFVREIREIILVNTS